MKGTLSPWILEPTSLLKICQLLFIRLIVTAYDIQLGDDTADDNYLIIGWDSITVCVIIICLLLKGHSAQANNDSLRGKTLTSLDTPFHHPYGYETISLPRGNDTFPFENVQLAVFFVEKDENTIFLQMMAEIAQCRHSIFHWKGTNFVRLHAKQKFYKLSEKSKFNCFCHIFVQF